MFLYLSQRYLLIMMRLNYRLLFLMCIFVFIITFSLWSSCGHIPIVDLYSRPRTDQNGPIYELKGIECHINNEEVIDCRKEKEEVYVPFSFLKKYFEIYGKYSSNDGVQQFDWSHSFSKIYIPKSKYDPRGIFMHFENYNVEIRDRVKCISAIDGVPISTQWESQGYYYPTQIAQFGLSHYSKNLTEPQQRKKVIEDGENNRAEWFIPSHSKLEIANDEDDRNKLLKFFCDDIVENGIVLKMDHVLDLVMGVDLFLRNNGSLKVVLQNRESKENYTLIYVASDILISAQDDVIYHGIGQANVWKHLTRDLVVDLQKGLALQYQDKSRKKLSKTKLKITSLNLLGDGMLDNLTLASSEHIIQFYAAAEWFVNNQDANTGGWPNAVRRRVAQGFAELQSGWYSAMGQGHAISVLARAYYHSNGDKRYLKAALAGLRPFRVPSMQGGVLATFLGKYPWYEEYPTTPASFVLNGFIYSLLGLYDLKTLAPAGEAKEAGLLYEEGILSLKSLLLLYDTGSGTSYDLRHFTLKVAPNLARWDYHATHVNQLLLLSTIDRDPLLQSTAERWMGYMTGKRAPHN